nr:unnamed protein product [Callosobruchus analis]
MICFPTESHLLDKYFKNYATVLKCSSNNVVQSARKEGQAQNVIQTQDSLQQHDIWHVTGILARYLIRIHFLKTCCDSYNKTLASFKCIDPTMYHNESKVMTELHERRLTTYASAMKTTFQHYAFNIPPIPEDVTFNRVKKFLPPPHLDMKWIIFVLFSLMTKEATYYYTHVSLKYLYLYIMSASQQLNGSNRNMLIQQQLQQEQLVQKQQQCKECYFWNLFLIWKSNDMAPAQLCALKNQIQQFNNICKQQQILNSKAQMTKKTAQKKRAPKRSKITKNPKPPTANGNSQVQLHLSPPYNTENVSLQLQDSNVSNKVASAINPKIMTQLLQATPAAPCSAQSSSRFVVNTMRSPIHTMSASNTSSAHVSTPVIRLKDPSSLMQVKCFE